MLVGAITVIGFFASLAAVTWLKPVFTTEAQVLVGNLETPFDRITGNDTQAPAGLDSREIDTQIAVLKSGDLGRRVVAALDLSENAQFNTLLAGMGKIAQLKVRLGFSDDPRLKTADELALTTYDSGLVVYQVPNSDVIAIKVSSGDPRMAAKVANALAEIYVSYTREVALQPTERARQWLAQQIDGLRGKVAEADAAVEKFRSEAGLLQGTGTTLGNQELSELNSQITVAGTARADARSRADSIRALLASKGSVDAAAEVLASPVIQGMLQQQTDAQKTVAELSAVYLASHPKMIAAQKQLDNINRRIRSEALKIVDGLDEQARIATAREDALRQRLDSLKKQAGGANLDDVKLKALERDAQANRALLETMLSRYAEATARLDPAGQPGNARVIQMAAVPSSPSFPKTGPMVLLVTIAALCFSLGLAFLLEIMAAAARLNVAIGRAGILAAALPAAATEPPRSAPVNMPPAAVPPPPLAVFPAATTGSAVAPAEAVAAVIAWCDGARQAKGIATLGIASLATEAEAGPCALAAIGRAMAAGGRRVIIVDAAGGSAWLQESFGAGAGQGLAELIGGTADITRLIIRDSRSTAHLMRFGQLPSAGSPPLLGERVAAVLSALARNYDAVLVNLGDAGAPAPLLASLCKAVLLLVPPQHLTDAATVSASLAPGGSPALRFALVGPAAASGSPRPGVAAAGA